MKQLITPCLWFDGQALEAAKFHCQVFPGTTLDYDAGLTVGWTVGGLSFMGLNGGPMFKQNPSVSFFWNSVSAQELKAIWNQLTAGGSILMPLDRYDFSPLYGWVQDRFGVNWQLMLREVPFSHQVHPSLMFTGKSAGRAREALEFWFALLPEASIGTVSTYPAGLEHDREGTINYAEFKVANQILTVMDSAFPHAFAFDEGISLRIDARNQDEIDHYWNRLTDGGEESMCGWLKDRFGLSWQIVPEILGSLMSDPAKAPRVMEAFMKMKKFDIAALEKASL